MDAIAWPDLGDGAGPIFWNIYHRWSAIRHEKRRPSSIPIEGQRALTGHLEGTKITEVLPVNPPTTEDIDYIIDHRRGMALPWGRNEADAGQLGPRPGVGVERPSIIVVVLAVCSTEPRELV